MQNSVTSKPRLDTLEAADFIGCASITIRISRGTGSLLGNPAPAYRKIGRKVVYDRGVLQAWIDQFELRNNTDVSGGEK